MHWKADKPQSLTGLYENCFARTGRCDGDYTSMSWVCRRQISCNAFRAVATVRFTTHPK